MKRVALGFVLSTGFMLVGFLGCDVTRVEDVTNPNPVAPIFQVEYQAKEAIGSFLVTVSRKGYGKRVFQVQRAKTGFQAFLPGDDFEVTKPAKTGFYDPNDDIPIEVEKDKFEVVGELKSDSDVLIDHHVAGGSTYRYRFFEPTTNSHHSPLDIHIPVDVEVSPNFVGVPGLPFFVNDPHSETWRHDIHRMVIRKGAKISLDTRWKELFIDHLIVEPGASLQITSSAHDFDTGKRKHCAGISFIVGQASGKLPIKNVAFPCVRTELAEDLLTFPGIANDLLQTDFDEAKKRIKDGPHGDADGILFIVDKTTDFEIQNNLTNTPAHYCVRVNGKQINWDKSCDKEEAFTRHRNTWRKLPRPGYDVVG